jgi:hypothetical protein
LGITALSAVGSLSAGDDHKYLKRKYEPASLPMPRTWQASAKRMGLQGESIWRFSGKVVVRGGDEL